MCYDFAAKVTKTGKLFLVSREVKHANISVECIPIACVYTRTSVHVRVYTYEYTRTSIHVRVYTYEYTQRAFHSSVPDLETLGSLTREFRKLFKP